MAVISDLWRAGIETDIIRAKGLSPEALLAEVRVAVPSTLGVLVLRLREPEGS
jgi:hypothetical protein